MIYINIYIQLYFMFCFIKCQDVDRVTNSGEIFIRIKENTP